MKIDVLPARELNFEGLGESENHHFLKGFVEGVKSALLEGTFLDFSHFWVSPGVQAGLHLRQKTPFCGIQKKYKKGTKTNPRKEGAVAPELGVWRPRKSAISGKSMQKH